jgi:hypothetical protein
VRNTSFYPLIRTENKGKSLFGTLWNIENVIKFKINFKIQIKMKEPSRFLPSRVQDGAAY